MILRTVKVTIEEGQYDAYWSWSRDILKLWDEGGVRRAGGPYALSGPDGEHIALWLSVHASEAEATSQFKALYADGRGRELILKRPALVSASESLTYGDWAADDSSPPAAPTW